MTKILAHPSRPDAGCSHGRLLPFVRMLVLAGAVALFAVPASAWRLAPLSLELEPSGRNAQGVFRIHNEDAEAIAVQVSIARRSVAEDGTNTMEPSSDEFVLFPTQLVLQPGKSQAVRVQYKGDRNLIREQSFRIITEQLPVNLQRERIGGAQVTMLLRYIGTLYVAPSGSKAAIAIEQARVEQTTDGKSQLAVLVVNNGTKHAFLSEPKLTIRSGGQQTKLERETLTGDLVGANVLAGGKRWFIVPLSAPLPIGAVEAALSFEDIL